MAEQASFIGAAWPAPPSLTLPLFQPETNRAENPGEIPHAFPKVPARGQRQRSDAMPAHCAEIPRRCAPRNDSGFLMMAEARCARSDGQEDERKGADADVRTAQAAEKRRAYNREYMRGWRLRNLERYRAQNREYQRRTAQRRKLRRLAKAAENAQALCWYGCGRVATQRIERVDPRTWKADSVPYCGKC